MISTQEPDKKFVTVNGKQMAYVEMGTGDWLALDGRRPVTSMH